MQVRGKDVTRPAIDACERCYKWWGIYLGVQMTWEEFKNKWNADPIFKSKIINAVKVANNEVLPDYRQKSVESHEGS